MICHTQKINHSSLYHQIPKQYLNCSAYLIFQKQLDCLNQYSNKVHILQLVVMWFKSLSLYRFPHILLFFSAQFICWRNWTICRIVFPIIWVLLIVSLWCKLIFLFVLDSFILEFFLRCQVALLCLLYSRIAGGGLEQG